MDGLARRKHSLPQRSAARGKTRVASETDRELRVVLTEHRPEASWAHCAGLSLRSPGGVNPLPPRGGRTRRRGYALWRPSLNDQFTEPFAAPAAAPDVDPLEGCAAIDPL